jgi:protein ImuB
LFEGEAQLLADAQESLAARGLAARLAIAPTAGAAWALAHHGPEKAILAPDEGIAARLAGLPVAALRLEPEVLLVLRRLGLKRIGELTGRFDDKRGRDALKRRFRRRAPELSPLLRLDQLLGRVAEPLLPVVERPAALVQRRLLEPLRHRALLDRVVADLAEDLVRALEARGEGARRLELGLWRVDGETAFRSLELAQATRDAAHVARLFAGKLDDVEAGFGIELVRLRAVWSEPLAPGQPGLGGAAEDRGTSLAVCLDRLTVRLGADAVRRPVLHASHLPERAQRWQAPLAPEPAVQEGLAFHARPMKLLDRPELIAVLYATPDGYPERFRWRGGVHDVVRVEGPERIAPEWWREKGGTRLRDYYRIEDATGRRYWIYRAGLLGDGRGGAPDWFLQGLCA